MKYFSTARLLSLMMLAACFSLFSCDEEDEETINTEMELSMAGDWTAIEFTFEYGTSMEPVKYEVCSAEAEPFYADYGAGLDIVSQHIALNGDKTAVLSPRCTQEDSKNYTWSVVNKSGGMFLKLAGNGTTILYKIQSWSIDEVELRPEGYNFESNFATYFQRPK